MIQQLPKDRCTGHCCEEFQLPFDQDGIDMALADTQSGFKVWQDMEFIYDMVIFIGPNKTVKPMKNGEGMKFWNWTCRHFDKEKHICTAYDKRPQMCRKHGVDYPCATNGCTLKSAKRDPELLKPAP